MNKQIEIIPVQTPSDVRQFIKLPYTIYQNDPHWVPPLESEISKLLNPESNHLLQKGPYQFFLAKKNGQIVARLGVGIDEKMNREKAREAGYLTLFESINDYPVVEILLDYAVNWLQERGIKSVYGPISPTNGDDYRGFLVMGFDSSPVLMNSYNPEYYPTFFERYGFTKDLDLYAYYYDLSSEVNPKLLKSVTMAQKRYGFRVDSLQMSRLQDELRDIKKILDEAMPEEWENLIPPEMDELQSMADQFTKLAEPTLINIARHGNRPIGFALALPNYNEVLKKVGGRLFPLGFLKYLWYKRKITSGRIFVMFVVPDFHKKGVSAAIYLHTLLAAQKLGYNFGEGSTIGEINLPMRRDAEGVGGVHYKTYRIYKKNIQKG